MNKVIGEVHNGRVTQGVKRSKCSKVVACGGTQQSIFNQLVTQPDLMFYQTSNYSKMQMTQKDIRNSKQHLFSRLLDHDTPFDNSSYVLDGNNSQMESKNELMMNSQSSIPLMEMSAYNSYEYKFKLESGSKALFSGGRRIKNEIIDASESNPYALDSSLDDSDELESPSGYLKSKARMPCKTEIPVASTTQLSQQKKRQTKNLNNNEQFNDFDYTIQGESEAIKIEKLRTIDLKKVSFVR